MTERDRPKITNENPDQTRIRLGERIVKFTDKRIDLVRITRGIVPPWRYLASGYAGDIQEATNLIDYALFNTWEQIQETGDDLLKVVAEQERGRLRAFFEIPLDDR